MVFPVVAPPEPTHWGGTIRTNLNLDYVRKFSCKYDIFLFSGSWEDFWMTPPIFAFWDYLPFEEDLALYFNNLESSLPKDNLYRLIWNWPAGFGCEDFFFNINTCKYGFPYCGPSRLQGTIHVQDLVRFWYRRYRQCFDDIVLIWTTDCPPTSTCTYGVDIVDIDNIVTISCRYRQLICYILLRVSTCRYRRYRQCCDDIVSISTIDFLYISRGTQSVDIVDTVTISCRYRHTFHVCIYRHRLYRQFCDDIVSILIIELSYTSTCT
jgi:hypothetical protein